MPHNKSFIDQASSVKIAGYWPRSLFACLWTPTSSRSIKTQKENSANTFTSRLVRIVRQKENDLRKLTTEQTDGKTTLPS